MSSFYNENELKRIPFKSVGKDVLISKKASIYSPEKVMIGNSVRIDDFCIISGVIEIGSNIHLAAYSALFGGTAGIKINDFANISSRVCIYAISDDYSGITMTNPTIPEKYKSIQSEPVEIGKHVIVGSGSTILPGVKLEEGTAVGAMSLCKETTKPWMVYAGIPAKPIKKRNKGLLKLENDYLSECI